MKKVLVTSAGGTGSNNMVESIKNSTLAGQVEIIGTHVSPHELVCSNCDKNYLVPKVADKEAYMAATVRLLKGEGIDLVMPNSDKEALVLSKHREEVFECGAKLFMPAHEALAQTQDKFSLHQMLKTVGVATARTVEIKTLDDLYPAFEQMGDCEKVWVRARQGAGSLAAAWMYNAEQAVKFVELWHQLRGVPIDHFLVSEFLPGRDYAVHTLWKDGELLVAKAAERLTYFGADTRLSGMASTPGVALVVDAPMVIEESLKAIEASSRACGVEPHGVYELDLKEDAKGRPCICEINIGRFPMINPVFDRTGKWCTAELFIRVGLDMEGEIPHGEIDTEEGVRIIRALDRPMKFVRRDDFASFLRDAGKYQQN